MIRTVQREVASSSNVNAPKFNFRAYVRGQVYRNNSNDIDFVTDNGNLYVPVSDDVTANEESAKLDNQFMLLVAKGDTGEQGVKGEKGADGRTPSVYARFDGKQMIFYTNVLDEQGNIVYNDNGTPATKRMAATNDLTGPSWKPELVNDTIVWHKTKDDEAPRSIPLSDLIKQTAPVLLRVNSDNTRRMDEMDESGPANYIQWKYEGDEHWNNLISISELMNLTLAGVSIWYDETDGHYHFGHKEVTKATYAASHTGKQIISEVELGEILYDAGPIPLEDWASQIAALEDHICRVEDSIPTDYVKSVNNKLPDANGNVSVPLTDIKLQITPDKMLQISYDNGGTWSDVGRTCDCALGTYWTVTFGTPNPANAEMLCNDRVVRPGDTMQVRDGDVICITATADNYNRFYECYTITSNRTFAPQLTPESVPVTKYCAYVQSNSGYGTVYMGTTANPSIERSEWCNIEDRTRVYVKATRPGYNNITKNDRINSEDLYFTIEDSEWVPTAVYHRFRITYSPANAVIKINDRINDNHWIDAEAGTHITWEVSAPGYITQTGELTMPNSDKTISVILEREQNTLELNPSSLNFTADGGSKTFTVTTNADSYTVSEDCDYVTTSKSGNTVTVTVDPNDGSERNCTLTVTAGNNETTLRVHQDTTPEPSDPCRVSIDISEDEIEMNVGQERGIHAFIVHSGDCSDTDLSISYSSSDTNIVTVASNGLLTAIAPGSATITASCAGETDTCPITVSEVPADTYRVTPSNTGGSCTNKAEYLGISENSYSDTTPFALDLTIGTHNLYVKATREHYEDKKWRQEVSGETTITLEDSPSGCEWTPIMWTLTVNGNGADSITVNGNAYTGPMQIQDGEIVNVVATRNGYTPSYDKNNFEMIKNNSVNITWTEVTPEYTPVDSVTIGNKPANNTITWNCGSTQTHALSSTVLPADATSPTVSWNSSKRNVATINSSGKITVVGVGTTVITATADGKSSDFTLTINRPEVESISLDNSSATLNVNETVTLNATLNPSCSATDITWLTSDSSVAIVSNSAAYNATITAKAADTATITAKTSNNKTATCVVTVEDNTPTPEPCSVTNVSVTPSTLSLFVGDNYTLSATVDTTGDDCVNTVRWITSNSDIVTVNNGEVVAVGAGSATVTAISNDDGNQSGSCAVTVTVRETGVQSVVMDCPDSSMTVGDSITLTATVYPANATDKTITWVQGQNPKGTISGNTFTATSSGIALIHAEAGGVSSNECGITIDPRPVSVEGISIDSCPGTIAQGLTNVYLTATIDPSDATNKNVTWSSSNSNIVAVEQTNDGRGHLIVKNTAGTATITVTTEDGNYEASCTITVPSTAIEFALSNQTESGNKIYYTISDNIDDSEWSETWNSLNYGQTTGTNPPLTISPEESLCITSENYPEDIQLEVNGTNRDDTNGFITMTYSELQQAAGYSNTYIVTFVREH